MYSAGTESRIFLNSLITIATSQFIRVTLISKIEITLILKTLSDLIYIFVGILYERS